MNIYQRLMLWIYLSVTCCGLTWLVWAIGNGWLQRAETAWRVAVVSILLLLVGVLYVTLGWDIPNRAELDQEVEVEPSDAE